MSKGMDYASAGVDIDLEGSAVASLIGALSKSVRQPGTPGAPVDLPGGFGGLVEFGDNLLALATDGVGSKLQIATMLEQWSGVGIDCMAMNVNDLLCVGAEPIAFVDYVAVPKPDPAIHAALGASLAEACRRARVTLAGGETASLPGIVTELDLSGTALGWLPKGDAITGEHLEEGDVLIGLPSSGIHSNGYSLVRKIVDHAGLAYTDAAPFDAEHPHRELHRWTDGATTLGEVVLNPTRIYCDPVVDLLNEARGEAPFKAWLYTVARNICRNEYRRRKPPAASLDASYGEGGETAAERIVNGNPGPASHAERRELGDQIRRAVESLPEKHREIFILHHYQGLKYDEIAEALGVEL